MVLKLYEIFAKNFVFQLTHVVVSNKDIQNSNSLSFIIFIELSKIQLVCEIFMSRATYM